MKKYGSKIKAQAKIFIIDEELSVTEAAKKLKEMLGKKAPCKSTIAYWANKKDNKGMTWFDYQKEKVAEYALSMSPQAMVNELMKRIKKLLADTSMESSKFSDSLAKISKAISQIVDPSLNFPAIFATLNDQINFAESFPDASRENLQFLSRFLRAYRDRIAERMGK